MTARATMTGRVSIPKLRALADDQFPSRQATRAELAALLDAADALRDTLASLHLTGPHRRKAMKVAVDALARLDFEETP